MLDLSKYQSIGEALRDSLDEFSNEVCLIEADREREKERLTYREFKERAHPLSKALQDAGFSAASRASIIMTNQSKWLISAYAIFYFFRGRRPGAARLQTHAGGAMATAQALERYRADNGISDLAATQRLGWPCSRD